MGHWRDVRSGREIWVIDAESVGDWPESPPWQSEGFCLLFASDHVVDVDPLARRALDQGAAFLSAWGPGCVVIEDAFDAMIVRDRDDTRFYDVATTSHSDESLDETLEFFIDSATPAPARAASCAAWVVFPIGAAFRTRVERALRRRGAEPRP